MTYGKMLTAHRNAMSSKARNDDANKIVCLQITVAEILNELIRRDLREVPQDCELEANVREWLQKEVLDLPDLQDKEV